jgi:tRNA uridine 5-carboxymethylaminomethyl modification enzyme
MRFPGVTMAHVLPDLAADPMLAGEIAEDARYAPYLQRQAAEVDALRRDESLRLDPALDYAAIPGLSAEMVERLAKAAPTTLGGAGRIRGITPAALSAILFHARKRAA